MEIERRIHSGVGIELRKASNDTEATTIRGYAAKFDSLSEPMWGFREKISPGAFDGVLDNDVRALFNHDPNIVLGRTKPGTLKIGVDEAGLWYELTPPDTRAAQDLLESIKRGDVDQSSFAFTVDDEDWSEDDEGRVIRTIKKFKRLYDVSPVTYPAYPDATVGVRSFQAFQERRSAEKDAITTKQAAEERGRREQEARERRLRIAGV